MANIERSGGGRMTRRQREQRAYQLTIATGVLTVVGVAGILLAVLDVIGGGLPVIALVLAAVCFFLLRRTLGMR